MRRISRGTPYVLTTSDIENVLASLTPAIEDAIAALLGLTVDEWRKQPKAKRVKQLVDFQNNGQVAATLAASAKAQTDLQEVAFAATQRVEAASVTADVQALKEIVADLVGRIDGLTGANARKGA